MIVIQRKVLIPGSTKDIVPKWYTTGRFNAACGAFARERNEILRSEIVEARTVDCASERERVSRTLRGRISRLSERTSYDNVTTRSLHVYRATYPARAHLQCARRSRMEKAN